MLHAPSRTPRLFCGKSLEKRLLSQPGDARSPSRCMRSETRGQRSKRHRLNRLTTSPHCFAVKLFMLLRRGVTSGTKRNRWPPCVAEATLAAKDKVGVRLRPCRGVRLHSRRREAALSELEHDVWVRARALPSSYVATEGASTVAADCNLSIADAAAWAHPPSLWPAANERMPRRHPRSVLPAGWYRTRRQASGQRIGDGG